MCNYSDILPEELLSCGKVNRDCIEKDLHNRTENGIIKGAGENLLPTSNRIKIKKRVFIKSNPL